MEVAVPVVHLNGTSGAELMAQLERAVCAAREAEKAMAEAAPNARDYYVRPGTFEVAVAQHWARVRKVEEARAELERVWEGVADQVG